MKRGMWVGKMLLFALLFVGFVYLLIAGTQYLWNWLVPALFSGPEITFWQTAGLLLLSKILLWPIGKSHHRAHQHGPWKYYWKDKWANMTPEERDRLKQKMRDKWGCYKSNEGTDSKSMGANG